MSEAFPDWIVIAWGLSIIYGLYSLERRLMQIAKMAHTLDSIAARLDAVEKRQRAMSADLGLLRYATEFWLQDRSDEKSGNVIADMIEALTRDREPDTAEGENDST